MTLTKNDLIQAMYAGCGLSKRKSIEVIQALFELMKKSLISGEDVLISGFGKFCVKDKNKRKGRNPATGNNLILDARRVVTFKSSLVLRDRINGNEHEG